MMVHAFDFCTSGCFDSRRKNNDLVENILGLSLCF
jgi:hypothetical protein